MLLLIGMPRSGTTWAGKIFDSHPQTLYRHEPDSSVITTELPNFPQQPLQHAALILSAQQYLQRMTHENTIKTSAVLPIFPKEYHNLAQTWVRSGVVWVSKLAERFGPRWARISRIPDMVSEQDSVGIQLVMKSVSAMARARLFFDAIPGTRVILMIRHPCGQVASRIQGRSLNLMCGGLSIGTLVNSAEAKVYGLTESKLATMSVIEKMAWEWVLFNQRAMYEMGDQAYLLRYEDLCADPVAQSRALFDYAGLAWNEQTATFLRVSTHASARQHYFSLYRNTAEQLNKWKDTLDRRDSDTIEAIVADTPPGRLYYSGSDISMNQSDTASAGEDPRPLGQ